jgi:hypothetical protein
MPFTFQLDNSSEESAQASVLDAIHKYNAYLEQVKETELLPVLDAMEKAKTAYFTALAELKGKLQELSEEEQRLSALMRVYDIKASLSSVHVSKLTYPHHFISTYEIIADRALE